MGGFIAIRIVVTFLFLLVSPLASAGLEFLDSKKGVIHANEGHTVLKWEGNQPVKLYKANAADFVDQKLVYEGQDNGFFMTGMADGLHFFKLISSNGEEAITKVSVKYPDKSLVIFSLVTGLFLFINLVLIIFLGNRKYANTTA